MGSDDFDSDSLTVASLGGREATVPRWTTRPWPVPLADDAREHLCDLTVELVDHIKQGVAIIGFWSKAQVQQGLRSWIFQTLDDADLIDFDRLDPLADKLMELTKANHHRLVR
jgi:hypothetical protein